MAEEQVPGKYTAEKTIANLKRAFAEAYHLPFETDISCWMRQYKSSLGMSPADYLKMHGREAEQTLIDCIKGPAMGVYD